MEVINRMVGVAKFINRPFMCTQLQRNRKRSCQFHVNLARNDPYASNSACSSAVKHSSQAIASFTGPRKKLGPPCTLAVDECTMDLQYFDVTVHQLNG